jgi:hypothetical protein
MEAMLNKNWEELLHGKTAQEAMDLLEQTINEAVDKCIPKKKFTEKGTRKKPLWMDDRTLRKVRRKHSAWIRYLNTKDGQAYQDYISKRNEAQHAIRRARRKFENSLAKNCRHNNKAVWGYINSRRSRPGISQLVKDDGSLTQTDEEIAEVLGDQYYKTFTQEDTTNIPTILDKELKTPPIVKFTATQDKVYKVLKNLKIDKSPGLDGMHPRLLNELAMPLSLPISLVYNISLDTGELPHQWKDAVISPIFKKGARKLPQNYRPVSLTSVICKVLEKLVVEQVTEHLVANDLKSPEQHGFTKGKSTVTNLLEAMNVWTEALMHGTPVDILYLDYAKAFDTVPHERLIRQVSSFGVKDKALTWIKAFLTGRRQKVRVSGKDSSWKPVDSGVPQGSVLGPTLFAMFVADVPDEVTGQVSLFADDTKVYAALNNTDATTNLNSDLHNLFRWSERMQMQFHPGKCKVMHLGKKNPHCKYTIPKSKDEVHILEVTPHEKDLGVTIDEELKFTQHVNNCVSKANRVLGCLRHTFKSMNKEVFLQLYKALVRPHLEYASCVWAPYLKRDIDALEWVQRRATKMVPGIRDLPYSERLRVLELPTLLYRRKRADMLQLYKLVHGLDSLKNDTRCAKCPTKGMLLLSQDRRTRGHDLKLFKQEASGIRSHFFSTRVVTPWNNLSQDTVRATNINRFKSALRRDWDNHPDLYSYNFPN